ncbi:MAG: DUF456 domain-containing protein [Pseudomonadota bacterium]
MTLVLIILGLLVALAGFVGCVFPIIPGPPLSFLALLILSLAKNWEPFSTTFLMVMAGLTILVTGLDYVVSALGAKKHGASKMGVWGSIVGMFLGIFVFPPFGMFMGAILGALVGELLAGKAGKEALRAGWGVLLGNIMGMVLKLAFCGIMLFFYIKEMF